MGKQLSYFLYTFLFFFIFLEKNQAQRRPDFVPGNSGTTRPSYPTSSPPPYAQNPAANADEHSDANLDTIKVVYFYPTQPTLKIPFQDTLLTLDFQQYATARKRRAEYAHLGFSASPHRAIVWQPTIREGFDIGIHAFDLFNLQNQNLRYYQTTKPFSEAKWTFRSINDDSNFDFNFGAQYQNSNFVSLEWHRTNQSSKPIYNFLNASGRNTNWAFGVAHLDKRYQCFASMAINTFEQNHNAGISIPYSDSLRKAIRFNNGFPVNLRNTISLNYRTQNFQWRHTYQLNGKDSSGTKRKFLLIHQFDFSLNNGKNTTDWKTDTSGRPFLKPLATETRGMRMFFDIKKVQNQFSIATQKPRNNQSPDLIELGLKHGFYNIHFEPLDTNIQNLFAFGKWDFSLSKWLKINTYAHFGLFASNIAEYCAKGDMSLNLQKAGFFNASFTQQRYQATFLQSRFYNFYKNLWSNDFSKTFATSLTAEYALPRFHFSAKSSYHLLNNYVYFGKNLQPTQAQSGVNILQLELLKDTHWRKLHLENYIVLQKSTSDAVNLPSLYGKHGLYVEGKIFRKGVMLARLGTDFRYNSAYNADGYHPFINQFYTQNDTEIPLFPALDAYISAKVGRTKVFFKMENISDTFVKNNYFRTVPNYPLYTTYYRLGFSKRFTD